MCIFCDKIKNEKPIYSNDLAVGYYDEFPVNKGHMLFITKRCVKTFFETTKEEQDALFDLLRLAKCDLDKKYKPDGYNIGFNCNEAAGQSIMHVHLHLIPRYKGDSINPRGGIRGVIEDKKNY